MPDQFVYPLVYTEQYLMMYRTMKGLTPQIQLRGETFILNPNDLFHVTLFNLEKYLPDIAQKLSLTEAAAEEKVAELLAEYCQKHTFHISKFYDDIRYLTKGEKKTIVCMCEVPEIEPFFDYLRSNLIETIPTQATHVTLYTLDGGRGVPLNSKEDAEKYMIPLTPDEITRLKKDIGFEVLQNYTEHI